MRYLIALFLCMNSHAQMKTNLYSKPRVEAKRAPVPSAVAGGPSVLATPAKRTSQRSVLAGGNLDREILVGSNFTAGDNQVVLPANSKGAKLRSIPMGDIIKADIKESVIAFPDGKAPVRAIVSKGPLKGSVFLGEATLEKNSKRILIEFKKLRAVRSDDDYQLIGSVLDPVGVLGLEGMYVSQEKKYFVGELVAAGAAGYADATINRNQNAYGNYVDAPTVDTASKKALGSALSKTAERFGERIKSAPEYSILEGPLEIQILIQEQPAVVN